MGLIFLSNPQQTFSNPLCLWKKLVLTQPIFYCNFHLAITSGRGSNSRCTWKFGSEAISSHRFLLLPLESAKRDFSHLPITAKLLLPSLETGKSNQHIQAIRNREKVKNGFWLIQEKGEDIGERKADIKRRIVSKLVVFHKKRGL